MKEMIQVVELPSSQNVNRSVAKAILAICTHPVFVYSSLILPPFCFIFIWLKSDWPRNKKWLITGIGAVIFGFGIIGALMEDRQLRQQLAEANQAWHAGKQQAAVARYTDLIKNQRSFVESNLSTVGVQHAPTIFGRTIDHFVLIGDTKSAKEILDLARKNLVSPRCETDKGQQFLDKFKQP